MSSPCDTRNVQHPWVGARPNAIPAGGVTSISGVCSLASQAEPTTPNTAKIDSVVVDLRGENRSLHGDGSEVSPQRNCDGRYGHASSPVGRTPARALSRVLQVAGIEVAERTT